MSAFKKLLACYLLTSLLALAVQAQDKPKEPKKSQVSIEYSTEGAPWYVVNGPRINLAAGPLSLAYVLLGEPDKNNQKTNVANDFHLEYKIPKIVTGPNLEIKPVFEHSGKRGYGGGLRVTKNLPGNTQLLFHSEGFQDGSSYADVKLLSRHLDLDAGLLSEGHVIKPYGYVTINWGKWDDTFTVGYSYDTLWNNFSFLREKWGTVSLTSYQSKTGNWTTETYIGRGNLNKPWFERDIDRLIANNDINPKERSYVLPFPSYLVFGNWSGEIRADHTGDKTFVNVGAGRAFRVGKLKIGLGAGVEHSREPGSIMWRPNAEALLEFPIYSWNLSVQKRFRQNEGNLFVCAEKRF